MRVEIGPEARGVVLRAWAGVEAIARTKAVYGRTTGVGANRTTEIQQATDFGLGMLRSHATTSGPVLDPAVVRAGILVRLNQIARGASGLHPDIIDALITALSLEALPVLHIGGAIGTADLGALGEVALTLMGERPFSDGVSRRLWRPHPGDALPILSSNAFTIALAARQAARARELHAHLDHAAALSLVAMRGSMEPLSPAVFTSREQPGAAAAAARQRELLGASDHVPARVQDSFGLRTLPQVHATVAEALDRLETIVGREANAGPENPMVDAAAGELHHNGNFHLMELSLALDALKLAVHADAALALTRVTDLSSPEMTGLPPFLGNGASGANGVMVLEYNAAAALRHRAEPATLGSVVISRGVENHSSFATQAALQLGECLDLLTDLLACELISACRALRMQDARLAPRSELAQYRSRVEDVVGSDLDDRSLSEDLSAVRRLVGTPIPHHRK